MGNTIFNKGADESDALANGRNQYIEIYHVPSGQSVLFKAFLNKYSDKYQSGWIDEEVFGRMDTISTFKCTKRVISLGWTVVAGSEDEAIENLKKCSLLYSMLYPSYDEDKNGATSISSSPLFKIKFMNLIQDVTKPGGNAATSGLLGKVSGFEYTPELEEGFFDSLNPNPGTNNDIGQNIYPQTIKLDCEFTVLHQHQLGWNSVSRLPRGQGGFARFPYADQLNPVLNTGAVRASNQTDTTVHDHIANSKSLNILSSNGVLS